LSDPELARLRSWPDETADAEAVTYFTLSAEVLSWLVGFKPRALEHDALGVLLRLLQRPRPTQLDGCSTSILTSALPRGAAAPRGHCRRTRAARYAG
jgi:hypothetical protein